ncbi:sugar phosphate isomerase/epimerase family protein [Kineococcus aurantiacus]|uniref:Sugar phosphate isomerase/epimerase n=1 Tax=Kineococcus aurantiacus TaxID=37633 RepID=A0A7Y9DQ07_9ACTN|nr:sugar phosphate isomerase/epimerase [Kineococcus aurantiacus]NYD24700.1 sugar phosphate isomerase/epimerase [Kineococcus aurantiacus]
MTLDTSAISVQLYTVRQALAADPDATLARLAAIGFRKVEPFGLTQSAGDLAPLLTKHGLSAPSAHAGVVGADLDAVLAAAQLTGTSLVIDPHVDRARWRTVEDIAGIAAQLNAAAERAADAGVTIGYHNHEFELEIEVGGRPALEVLADHLSEGVALEIDTYWAVVGGVQVSDLMSRLGSRVKAVHLKDGDGSRDDSKQVAFGTGDVDVDAILAAVGGDESQVELGVIELDDTTGDMWAAVETSYANLVKALS